MTLEAIFTSTLTEEIDLQLSLITCLIFPCTISPYGFWETFKVQCILGEHTRHIRRYTNTKQLYAEACSRRENLNFFGLAEKETQGTEVSEAINTRELLFEFLKNGLGFEDPEKKFELQRVHRLGKPASGKTRPIIARFLRYQDREMVLRASFHLRDREIKVLEDYPQEIIERRRKQMSKLKEAKRNGMKVSFSKAEPDKLYINGKFVPA